MGMTLLSDGVGMGAWVVALLLCRVVKRTVRACRAWPCVVLMWLVGVSGICTENSRADLGWPWPSGHRKSIPTFKQVEGSKYPEFTTFPSLTASNLDIMGDAASEASFDTDSPHATAEVICQELLKVLARKEVEQPLIWCV